MKKSKFLRAITLFIAVFMCTNFFAQTLPYTFVNNSSWPDDQVYIAIVGITTNHVWVDPINGAVHPMDVSYNTVPGPVYNGDMGPGGNALYANCFRPLSQIPGKVINIPKIAGCRIMFSFGSQLYLYFFGSTGGYSAPNLSNPNDPNQGIKFEMTELTYNDIGLWINTTRVDCYQYPVGLEVWGTNGFYKKVGEVMSHEQIISQWQATAPSEFQGLCDAGKGMITFPTKHSSFPQSLIQGYIDQIWSKYSGQQLVFSSGDAGVWRGSVSGSSFVFTRDSDGQVATIAGKPSTLEAMEALGVMAQGGQWDLVIQAQIAAAINRHAINLNLGSGVMQDFGTHSQYYQTWPYNWYAKFFHRTDISYDGYTYAFSYDDVFDHSATVHTPNPQSIKITLGGFNSGPNPTGVTGLGGTFTLQNRYSGKNLEVDGGQIGQDGGNVQQWSATSGDNQKFQLIEVSSGVYRIMNVQSGKCVDISGVSTANGANVHQWAYVGGANQHFTALDAGGGYYKFVATHSNKLIEVGGFNTSDGGNVQQWEDAGQQTGQWKLNPANNNGGPLANGTYVIQNRYSGLYLDVDANTINQDGANVQQWQLYNTTNQKFTIANLGGDLYSIISVGSGKSLDVSGASTANGANIQQWTFVAVPQQEFHIVPVDGAYYKIIASHSNKLVEVGGFNTSNGGNIQQWEDAGQQTGHWQFIAAAKSAFSQLSEEEVIEDIEIYPNPVTSTLNIKGVSSDATIEIYNTMGQKVLEDKGEQINIEALNSGIYYLKINSDNQLVTRTFIKN